MLIWPDCIPCILKMSLEVARQAMKDESQLTSFMQEALEVTHLRGGDWAVTPPELIRDIWLKINEISGDGDPLKEMKAEQNRQALELCPLAKELVSKSRDPLLEAVKLAVLGNSRDFMGNGNEEPIGEIVGRLPKLVVRPEAVEELRRRLGEARRLVYLGDNCGEIVFDRLLIEVIRDTYDPEITFITRSVPILNDATLEDALAVGIDRVARIMENGIPEPLPATLLSKVSPELKALIEESDLVIAKGGGNHDILTEEGDLNGKVSFLVLAKCHPYCTIHQLPLGGLIVHNS